MAHSSISDKHPCYEKMWASEKISLACGFFFQSGHFTLLHDLVTGGSLVIKGGPCTHLHILSLQGRYL